MKPGKKYDAETGELLVKGEKILVFYEGEKHECYKRYDHARYEATKNWLLKNEGHLGRLATVAECD